MHRSQVGKARLSPRNGRRESGNWRRSPKETAALREKFIKNQYAVFVRLAVKQYVMLPGHAFCTDPGVFKAPGVDECYGPEHKYILHA